METKRKTGNECRRKNSQKCDVCCVEFGMAGFNPGTQNVGGIQDGVCEDAKV